MQGKILIAGLLLGAGSVQAQSTPAAAPVKSVEVGVAAPEFELPAATRYGVLREPIKLADFKGKTVIVAFFPKARSGGCTIQMRAYRDQYEELFRNGQDAILIAVSADTPEALASWAKDEQFPFVMASDKDLKLANALGAVGRAGMTNRNLFLIGPDGKVAYRALPFREVDPTSYTELSAAIKKNLPAASGEQK